MDYEIGLWIGFNAFLVAMLMVDLVVFHREAHEVSTAESALWTAGWIGLALLFNLGLWHWRGGDTALEFLTGYVIEKSLSVDNLFVFLVLFRFFRVPGALQHRVLFWGVLGALVMRLGLILAGTALVHRFEWVVYLFGAFLIYSGVKMTFGPGHDLHPNDHFAVKFIRRVVPIADDYHGQSFVVRRGGTLLATPLLIVLVVIECSDLLFALDSVPAIIAVTREPFLAYTSNAFAILGLRALYFLIAQLIQTLRYLEYGLAAVLIVTGLKMLAEEVYRPPTWASLLTIVGILAFTVVVSLLNPKPVEPPEPADDGPDGPAEAVGTSSSGSSADR